MEQINPLVTVIIITRNRKILLKRAVDSVLNQTYKNIEVIIVDGASTDGTDELIKQIKDDRMTYIRQNENVEPRISIDIAFNQSKGDYICFLDDDDEYLQDKILKQVDGFRELSNEYGLIYCWAEYIDDRDNSSIRIINSTLRGNIFLEQIERQSIGGTPCIMIRRGIYNEFNGWNKQLNYVADWEFITRISRKYKVEVIPEILVKVHINHSYERQSKVQSELNERTKIRHLLEFHTYYLEAFGDGYLLKPTAAIPHYISAIRLSIMLRKNCDALKLSKSLLVLMSYKVAVVFLIVKVWISAVKVDFHLKKPY